MAGILDTARFSAFIAWETGSSVKDVTAMVLGGHGDQMVPVVSATTVGGVPLEQLVPRGRITKMVERTRKGGGELVELLGTSAWYAPGAAAAQMVDAICLDEKRVLPCTAFLEGEYGVDGLYFGVPVKLGAGGVEEVVKLKLSTEKKMLKARRRPCASPRLAVVGDRWSASLSSHVREFGLGGPLRTLNSPSGYASRAMDLGLQGRSAIVCGASSGIGLAIAEAHAPRAPTWPCSLVGATCSSARPSGSVPCPSAAISPIRSTWRALVAPDGDGLRRARHPRPERWRAASRLGGGDARRAGRSRGRAAPDSARPPRRPDAGAPAREWSRSNHRDRVDVREGADRQPRPLERRPAGRRRLAAHARTRAGRRRDHREHDRAGADRHRAAALARPARWLPRLGSRADPAPAPGHPGRGRRRRLLPRVGSRPPT